MKSRTYILACLFGLAVLTAKPVEATNYVVTVKVHPGVGSNTGAAWMNCGWHTTCASPYTGDGPGVDWWGVTTGKTCCGTGTNVYYRSFNYMAISGSIGDVRTLNYASDACYEAEAQIRDTGAVVVGTVIYQHTSRTQATSTYAMSASPGGTFTGTYVSTMVNPDKCSAWTGVHTHEKHLDGSHIFTRNIGSPSGHIPHQYDTTGCAQTNPCKYLYQAPGSQSSVWERSVAYNVSFGCPC